MTHPRALAAPRAVVRTLRTAVRGSIFLLASTLALGPRLARGAGPTVLFTLPAENTTPAVFGSLPFPDDLYFDRGRPADGDGTLLDAGATIGLADRVVTVNAASIEDALDLLDGFGTTTAVYFFLSGPLDPGSLPASPVLGPALTDGVFCADAASATPVPVLLEFGIDSRIPNVLAVLPLPGKPLAPQTTYACVVRRSVTGGGAAVQPSADWLAVRDGTSANADADAICAASGSCETTDERFTRDASGTPVVIDVPPIPFTVVVPSGTPPAAGWPVIIQQHALGGDRGSVVAFGEADAARGFASIGIDAAQHGYRY